MQEKIIILDFGSQTTQLIGRRVRELNMYCEIVPYNKFPHDDPSVIGVILSGSPFSVYDEKAFKVDLTNIRGKYPILGICYGAQFMSYTNGGKVEPANTREYGRAHLATFDHQNPLLKGIREHSQVWMSHGDTITTIPDNFEIIASTDKVAIAAYQAKNEKLWGVQFHPEVFHSEDGTLLLKNFVVDICGGKQDWSAASFIETTVAELKQQLGDDKVVLGLSGGVDSSVAAVLLNKAIGKNLTCIFVDHGMLRKNEFKNVLHDYECLGLNVIGVDASEKFFSELAGVTEPERKRMHVFNRLRQSRRWWLAPTASTLFGNVSDTLAFFFIAFWRSPDAFMAEHWMEIALVDYCFKVLISIVFFLPMYGVSLNMLLKRLADKSEINALQAS